MSKNGLNIASAAQHLPLLLVSSPLFVAPDDFPVLLLRHDP
jgi:hypothetical protein